MSEFSYLITILVFGGVANAVLWWRNHTLLFKHRRFLLLFVIGTAPFAAFEGIALRWSAWMYAPDRTLHRNMLGAELESYLFMALVAAAVASATIVFASRENNNRRAGAGPESLARSRRKPESELRVRDGS